MFEEVNADLICATHLENNPASGKVMKKAHMKYEARLRQRINDKSGMKNDLLVYSLTKEEYLKEEI